MENKEKNIIVFVNSLPSSAVEAVRKLEKIKEKKYQILVLRDSRVKNKPEILGSDIILDCDFSKPSSIASALLPHQSQLAAITCRSESNIARFVAVIPHVPYLRTPSTESLVWATDKYEMRKRLRLFDAKNTPRFTLVKSNTKEERLRVSQKVGFPLIVKPTSLAASALVSICYHEEEFEKTLRSSFRKLRSTYKKAKRVENPQLMAEEYMEGKMYSVDSYVTSRGTITHCPLVYVTTGKSIGHDDFYNYIRMTPVQLKKESIVAALSKVENGIKALGLRSTSTHTELLNVDGDWKIIEIGPRIGGFRHVLHKLSCDIDHSLNDLLVRFPIKTIIPKTCKGFAAVMRYYSPEEGLIEQISGIKKIQELSSYDEISIKAKVGDRTYFSKNGGKGIFDLTLYNTERAKLLADIRRVEQMVEVKVATRGNNISKNNDKKMVVKKKTVKKKVGESKSKIVAKKK